MDAGADLDDQYFDSRASEIAERLHLKRTEYPPRVTSLVQKLRAAAYKRNGTDVMALFDKLDRNHSGGLDFEEFKQVTRRWVHARVHALDLLIVCLNRMSALCSW